MKSQHHHARAAGRRYRSPIRHRGRQHSLQSTSDGDARPSDPLLPARQQLGIHVRLVRPCLSPDSEEVCRAGTPGRCRRNSIRHRARLSRLSSPWQASHVFHTSPQCTVPSPYPACCQAPWRRRPDCPQARSCGLVRLGHPHPERDLPVCAMVDSAVVFTQRHGVEEDGARIAAVLLRLDAFRRKWKTPAPRS